MVGQYLLFEFGEENGQFKAFDDPRAWVEVDDWLIGVAKFGLTGDEVLITCSNFGW